MRLFQRLFEAAPGDGGGGGGEGAPAGEGEGEAAPSPEVVAEARKMGWSPRQYWRGNPDHWIDAEEFVRRGKDFVPFLQSDRRKLQKDLEARDAQIAALRGELTEVRDGVQALTQFSQEMARDRVSRRKQEIGAEMKAARDAGDTVRETELQTELGETIVRERELKKPLPGAKQPDDNQNPSGNRPPANSPPQVQLWVKTFIDGNQDFFNDPERRNMFNAVAATMREGGDRRVGEAEGTEFLAEARDRVETLLGGNRSPRQRPPKAGEDGAGGGGGGGGGGSPRVNGKRYQDLPEAARARCDAEESKFVGTGKIFKTQAEWRKYYLSEFFGPSTTGVGE